MHIPLHNLEMESIPVFGIYITMVI
jgi:hypothetical protein